MKHEFLLDTGTSRRGGWGDVIQGLNEEIDVRSEPPDRTKKGAPHEVKPVRTVADRME